MLWLYIILGIVLLISLLLALPIRLKASYHKDFNCVLYIGFIRFQIYPPKPEKPIKKKAGKPKTKKAVEKKEETNLLKEKGLSWIVNLIKKIAELSKGVLKDFFKHIIIKNLMLSIKVVGSDAADTAVQYGYYCSAVYPAVGIIVSAVKCRHYGVDIAPDFNENAKQSVNLDAQISTRVFWVASIVLRHGIKALKVLLELKK